MHSATQGFSSLCLPRNYCARIIRPMSCLLQLDSSGPTSGIHIANTGNSSTDVACPNAAGTLSFFVVHCPFNFSESEENAALMKKYLICIPKAQIFVDCVIQNEPHDHKKSVCVGLSSEQSLSVFPFAFVWIPPLLLFSILTRRISLLPF